MAYFYHFELILVGMILLSALGFAGVKLWLKQKSEKSEINDKQSKIIEDSDNSSEISF